MGDALSVFAHPGSYRSGNVRKDHERDPAPHGGGYHTFNDWDTQLRILKETRQTYDGPVEVAVDYMVFNVTKEDIKVRMAAVDEDIWPLPSITEKKSADPADRVGFSDEIFGGQVVFKDVIK